MIQLGSFGHILISKSLNTCKVKSCLWAVLFLLNIFHLPFALLDIRESHECMLFFSSIFTCLVCSVLFVNLICKYFFPSFKICFSLSNHSQQSKPCTQYTQYLRTSTVLQGLCLLPLERKKNYQFVSANRYYINKRGKNSNCDTNK